MLSNAELLAVEEAIRKETTSLNRLVNARPLTKAACDAQKDLLQSALVKLKESVNASSSAGKKV